MRRFLSAIFILSLVFFTIFVKKSTKDLDEKIYLLNAKIGSLSEKYEMLKLEYDYLTSPQKISEYKQKYFDEVFIEKNIKDFGKIIIKKNYIIIDD